jgi:hypothetical protein
VRDLEDRVAVGIGALIGVNIVIFTVLAPGDVDPEIVGRPASRLIVTDSEAVPPRLVA